jgi:predicted RNase H-like HicB family nuclease
MLGKCARSLRAWLNPEMMDRSWRGRHIRRMQFTVTVSHDEAERVWFVQSSDVPGLNAEASTLDELVAVITDVAPELIASNMPDADLKNEANFALRVQHVVNARRMPAA